MPKPLFVDADEKRGRRSLSDVLQQNEGRGPEARAGDGERLVNSTPLPFSSLLFLLFLSSIFLFFFSFLFFTMTNGGRW